VDQGRHEPTEAGVENFGPFVLMQRIAVGGSAEVYLARPKWGDRPAPRLVVKRLLPVVREQSDFDVLEREARLHQAVQHPNVVKVFGAGMVSDEPYIALEYIEGVDVYRLLRRAEADHRLLPPGLALFIAGCVADALQSIHTATDDQGRPLYIVHRDVNPSNIYLSVDGDVKVGDFGIARASRQRRPGPHPSVELKGKFGYLAPEQVAGEPFDHRADLFALSALLGEMLIGERVFPGNGQLAVLLAIRDADLEPLRAKRASLPEGLLPVLERGLARHPEDRYASAEEFASALVPFASQSVNGQRNELAEWVRWARDSGLLAQQLEGKIRDSVRRMRAVRLANSVGPKPVAPSNPVIREAPVDLVARVRRPGATESTEVSVPKLLEMLATGELARQDEVALMGEAFRPIGEIDELARHLLPSTAATTRQIFEPGVPDYQAMLEDTPLVAVLARLRRDRETGALFVQRHDRERRREIYVNQGKLVHVAASERDELLGEYLIRRGVLERRELEVSLATIAQQGGRLGDTLIARGLVDAVDVFRAIRDLGRDRVAAVCDWRDGLVTFYRGNLPGPVDFPLDLDLASPMMAGVIVASHGSPRALLPDGTTLLAPGPRFHEAEDPRERGTAPSSLLMIPMLLPERVTVDQTLSRLTALRVGRGGRSIAEAEACAALLTAFELGWIRFEI
jgi:eukaryotic-like serine/threonine-protein kinase